MKPKPSPNQGRRGVNYRVKRMLNRLFSFVYRKAGQDQIVLFPFQGRHPDKREMHKIYKRFFDQNNLDALLILEDLAIEAGFMAANPKLSGVQEGKRALFLYILKTATVDPYYFQKKEPFPFVGDIEKVTNKEI